jgi:hypothetical protein
MEARKDAAYRERNQVVAGLAMLAVRLGYKAGRAKTAIEGWSEDWHGCVYIDLPTGQVSWHFHDSQASFFDFLPPYEGKWDGHDTEEKYGRLAAMQADLVAPPAASGDAERRVVELAKKLRELVIYERKHRIAAGATLTMNALFAAIDALSAPAKNIPAAREQSPQAASPEVTPVASVRHEEPCVICEGTIGESEDVRLCTRHSKDAQEHVAVAPASAPKGEQTPAEDSPPKGETGEVQS